MLKIENQIYEPMIPVEFNNVVNFLDRMFMEGKNVAILDDIDTDGVLATYICRNYITLLNPNIYVNIYNNNQHGVTQEMQDMMEEKSDFVIILDSSTNEAKNITFSKPTLIIDHHEIQEKVNKQNLLICNSHNTKGLENISAGFLVYTIFNEYKNMRRPEYKFDLFDLAVATLYSDVIAVTPYVSSIIQHSLEVKRDYNNLINIFNPYNNGITKSFFQYSLCPPLNFTAKTLDHNLLQLLYEPGMERYAYERMQNEKKKKEKIFEMFNNSASISQNEKMIFCDLTKIIENSTTPLQNLKGLFASKISGQNFSKPTIVGFVKQNNFEMSVRSPDKDSLSYFLENKSLLIKGGGHKSACGFVIPKENLGVIIKGYSDYISKTTHRYKRIEIPNIESLNQMENELYNIALYNEFAYSNIQPIEILVDRVDFRETGNRGFQSFPNLVKIGKVYHLKINAKLTITLFNKIESGCSIKINPCLNSKFNKTLTLFGEPILRR